jgi:hypothetical protein
MAGARPTRATFPARPYRTVKQEAINRGLTSITDPMSFYRLYTEYYSKALIAFCWDVLDEAVARTPYRTGELRSSGKVTVRTGVKQVTGMVFPAIDVRADSKGNWELRTHIHSIKRPSTLTTAEISFERIDDGKDIALWAHEELLDYSLRPGTAAARRADADQRNMDLVFYATKPGAYGVGTGPKYLEGPYMEKVGRLAGIIQEAVNQAIREYNRRSGQRVRRR